MANRRDDYFEMLVEMGGFARESAGLLKTILEDFNPGTLQEKMDELHEIEHKADNKKHVVVERLAKEFITPIEREDILELLSQLDDVVDGIEDVLIKIYMYNVKKISADAIEFAGVIVNCCDELNAILKEFHNFKKSKTIHKSIVELNRLECVGDEVYVRSVRKLYETGSDPIEVMAWTAVFSRMERCCDDCEHAANLVEEVIMKNT